ncbi:hypothetical protein RY831_05690 [Noviherbaspirillum sp. CPCC 100848]|uniref:Virulence factor n=1 Tax=Noviherbaspirillum album TaxID=3080276 RepID=A0ABU6J4T8_9BURK|nr:hypothetical protein [Noviherbaspirillum sp. CPCC 100848]MEC4718631.1 hypothetical protein [Noviherbaspirillum sp. CPCC 100848]
MKTNRKSALQTIAGILLLAAAPLSLAGGPNVNWSVTVNSGYPAVGIYTPPPVYVQPQPVYVRPQPVYVQPVTVVTYGTPYYVEKRHGKKMHKHHWKHQHQHRHHHYHHHGYRY